MGRMRRIVGGLAAVACVAASGGALPGATAAARPGAADSATSTPVVDLLEGRADARVAITRDGRRAVVHQGSSYDPEALLSVDLTAVPPAVTGSVPVPADAGSALALVGSSFAWTTDDRDLWVTDVRAAQPASVGKVGFRVGGDRATLFDVVVDPKGRVGYATADDSIHEPGSTLLVLKVRKDGRPRLVRSLDVRATHLAVSRDGRRLAAAAGTRVHLFDLRKPASPRRLGRPVKVRGDVRALSFGASARDLYAVTSGAVLAVSRLHTGRGKVARRASLVRGSSSSVSGDVAVSADGRRVVATADGSGGDDVSVWALDPRLRPVGTGAGPCYPGSVAASLAGPTRGRVYVADSGICEQARLWQVGP